MDLRLSSRAGCCRSGPERRGGGVVDSAHVPLRGVAGEEKEQETGDREATAPVESDLEPSVATLNVRRSLMAPVVERWSSSAVARRSFLPGVTNLPPLTPSPGSAVPASLRVSHRADLPGARLLPPMVPIPSTLAPLPAYFAPVGSRCQKIRRVFFSVLR